MLLRAPVQAVRTGQIGRRGAHIAVVMRRYPRGLGREMVDEYVADLAPAAELFDEFKAREREIGDHDLAFAVVRYEERFEIGPAGLEALQRLGEMATRRDVYLVCQCTHDQRCHADLLLLTARVKFGAPIGALPFTYPTYEARLKA